MKSNNRWLNGPAFLWKQEDAWPPRIEIRVLSDDDPEVRKNARIYATVAERDHIDDFIHHFSCWWKLKKAVAWMLRFKQILQAKVRMHNLKRSIGASIQKVGSSVWKLRPSLRNGMLSVGGRLENAQVDGDLRHPYLPNN